MGDLRAQLRKEGRVAEEFDNFLKLRFFLVRAGYILEINLILVGYVHLGFGFTETAGLACAAARTLTHDEIADCDKRNNGQNVWEDADPDGKLVGLRIVVAFDDARIVLLVDKLAHVVDKQRERNTAELVFDLSRRLGFVLAAYFKNKLIILYNKGFYLFLYEILADIAVQHRILRNGIPDGRAGGDEHADEYNVDENYFQIALHSFLR